jgi:NDP-sugar pyrophosphorylase family protein
LRSGENLYPDDVRREYLTYAEKALTEHTPPTASEAPRSELPPVVILPRRPEWPRSGIAALAQPESELLGNRSIMQHLVESLAGSGVQEIYIPEGAAVSESPGIRHVRYPERLADGTNLSALADLVGDRRVLLCYGDCLADVDLPRLLAMHLAASKQATVISARPSPLLLALTGDIVPVRHDRPHLGNGGGVNGGYTVLEPRALRGAEHGHALAAVLEHLLDDDQLTVYRHTGFWEAVRTRPVLNALNQLWFDGRAPWVTGKRTPPHAAALPADELAQKDDLFGA